MDQSRLYNTLKAWIPLAIISTLLFLLISWAVQQNYRLSANDPQIQMAQDSAVYLKNGGKLDFATNNKVEISESLSPYFLVFNSKGDLISYSGVLHSKAPAIPNGVFGYTKKYGEDKFTWQPEVGVRSAAIMEYYSSNKISGYVLVGRSLKEVEKREDLLTFGTFATWVTALLLSLISIAFFESMLVSKLKQPVA